MKKSNRLTTIIIMSGVTFFVFIVSLLFLIFGRELAATFDVIGIRIATLFVAFASFCSTSLFSFLIFNHNKTVRISNEDANKRASMFRELQFSSSNYSVLDFTDSMTLYKESSRYVDRFVYNNNLKFHMISDSITATDVLKTPQKYSFLSLKIPYTVIEGKMLANITFEKLKFEREGKSYRFVSPPTEDETYAFLLYNELNKKSDCIINLIIDSEDDFFRFGIVNEFSKIKMTLKITSLLGVEIRGIIELYFTNPEHREQDGSNTYKINSSNFILTELPKISDLSYYKSKNQF